MKPMTSIILKMNGREYAGPMTKKHWSTMKVGQKRGRCQFLLIHVNKKQQAVI